jgi:transposase-like protein
MAHHYYSLEQKIEFLDAYKELGILAAAAKKVDVPMRTSRYWIKIEKKLRDAYGSPSLYKKPAADSSGKYYKWHSLEEKLKCIREFEQGASYREVANLHTCSKSSIQDWCKRRDELLALYYTQHDAQEVESYLNDLTSTLSGAGEDEVPKDELTKDLTNKIKKQEKEIELLKDKITFLENLNKILQERSGPIKKKNYSERLNEARNPDEET